LVVVSFTVVSVVVSFTVVSVAVSCVVVPPAIVSLVLLSSVAAALVSVVSVIPHWLQRAAVPKRIMAISYARIINNLLLFIFHLLEENIGYTKY